MVARLRLTRATILNLMGDVDAAEREFDVTLALFRRTSDTRMLANALWSAAFMFRERGLLADAERLHRELLELDLGGESFVGAKSRFDLAQLVERRQDDDEAARLYREAAEMTRRTDRKLWGEATDGYARALLASGRVDEARRALEEFESSLTPTECLPPLHTLQMLYQVLGDEEGVIRVGARIDPTH
jgi:tetratricopeptide (TPR) repeat protein